MDKAIPALIADNQMRQRDERLEGQGRHKAKDPLCCMTNSQQGQAKAQSNDSALKDFRFNGDNTCHVPGRPT
jgi:hypothetical protein